MLLETGLLFFWFVGQTNCLLQGCSKYFLLLLWQKLKIRPAGVEGVGRDNVVVVVRPLGGKVMKILHCRTRGDCQGGSSVL